MSPDERAQHPTTCPDCGRLNPAGRTSCERCNFPFEAPEASPETPAAATGPEPASEAGDSASGPDSGGANSSPVGSEADASTPVILRRRPRRPPRGLPTVALSMWLLFGGIAAIAVIWAALQANIDRARAPVEGARVDQQKQVDELRDLLARDSTNADAHVALADLLYDTGNWPDAIVHYKAAVRRDSTRTTAIVDLGVCYYNLGESAEAERLFRLALSKSPNQPVALFNLGILHERRKQYEQANQYFHRALASNPPEDMKPAILASMQRVQEATGAQAPALPEGAR